MDGFIEFAKYGMAGICVLLIGALIYVFKLFYKSVANHINHNTQAFHEMRDVMTSLREIIKERLK